MNETLFLITYFCNARVGAWVGRNFCPAKMFGCTVFVTYCGSADYLIIIHEHDTLYNDPANYLYIRS